MFYVTTPIYYVNDEPHLGHAYATILADVLARYHRLRGEEVFFLTGVDEHGQKVQNAVRRNQIADPQAYVDQMAARFQATWKNLHIQPDDFIRTTEPRHVRVVQSVLQKLWEAGEIYRGEYEGWYCVPDERFWTEKDLKTGPQGEPLCPDCARPVEKIIEANYFFKMGRYQDWLVRYIQEYPDFIQPAYRRNEVLGFLRQPLGDLCISRPAARLSWGIPLPFAPDYVTYVWFDALLNYVTAAGYGVDDERFARLWPNALHLIGKDILTTHSVYWPTMLKAMDLPLPQEGLFRTLFATGWWVVDGTKMGKSLGNAVRPLDLADHFGVDAFRYFLMRDMAHGQDADFDAGRVAARYAADLANNLGNLLQRVVNMVGRYCGGQVPAPGEETDNDRALRAQVEALPDQVFDLVERVAVHAALAQIVDTLTAVNAYLERAAPWTLAKSGSRERVGTVLYTAGEALRLATVLLSPVLPERTTVAWARLGWQPAQPLNAGLAWGGWQPGCPVTQDEPLFPRKEI
jgi:methionyl-tRNA synthetase